MRCDPCGVCPDCNDKQAALAGVDEAVGRAMQSAILPWKEVERAHRTQLARLRAAVTEADRLTDEALTGLIDIREALSYFQKIKAALAERGDG